MLVAWHVGVIEGNRTAGDHGDFEVHRRLEVVNKLLEGHGSFVNHDFVEDRVSFGDALDGSAHDRVVVLRLVALYLVGLAEEEQADCEVDEAILELVKLVETLDELKDFVSHSARDHRCCRGNCGNNFSCDELGLVEVRLADLVVAGS